MILSQEMDPLDKVITELRECIADTDKALDKGYWHSVIGYDDVGLTAVAQYTLCRDEGFDEPYCVFDGCQSADAWVGAVERQFIAARDMANEMLGTL
jgi:hypothetical protein